jgi:HUS1 checkpoint protein
MPYLCLTITTASIGANNIVFPGDNDLGHHSSRRNQTPDSMVSSAHERETVITQDIPVRVLSQAVVESIHEPRCREPDVHIVLPPLTQLKNISDRFTKLAAAARSTQSSVSGLTSVGPRLDLYANMHGCMKIGTKTDAMTISSLWTGLTNPELDPAQVEGGVQGLQDHPSTRMRRLGNAEGTGDEGWARVRIDGRDWGKVMSVGRLGAKQVIACKCGKLAPMAYSY